MITIRCFWKVGPAEASTSWPGYESILLREALRRDLSSCDSFELTLESS